LKTEEEKRDKCSSPVRRAGLAARWQNKFTGKPISLLF
jgi:hypothetical protein